MGFFQSLFGHMGPFILLLGILVFIHEMGHYLVAKFCGVKVQVFSIGFGPKLIKWNFWDTEFCLSLIPFGGYVKMFGDNPEAEVAKEDQDQSFIHKKLWQRFAIVFAGPFINLVFAILLFSHIAFHGNPEILPFLGDLPVTSSSYQAGLRSGDKILKVNETEIEHWSQLDKVINSFADKDTVSLYIQREKQTLQIPVKILKQPNSNPLSLKKERLTIADITPSSVASGVYLSPDSSLKSGRTLQSQDKILKINNIDTPNFYVLKNVWNSEVHKKRTVWNIQVERKDLKDPLTFQMKPPSKNFTEAGLANLGLTIGQVQKSSPAAKAGLLPGDRISKIDGSKLADWTQVTTIFKNIKEKSVIMSVFRDDKSMDFTLTPKMQEIMNADGTVDKRPLIGIMSAIDYTIPETKNFSKGFFGSINEGFAKSYEWTIGILVSVYKLITGQVSSKSLGGFMSIGQVAKQSLDTGWTPFLQMMAILSINLFVFNLLPIPVLDGGHLLFYAVEAIKGSPVSLKKMILFQQVGMVLLLGLMLFSTFNDVSRIFLSGW